MIGAIQTERQTTMPKIAMAAAAHPDDIEFMMAGTLMLLKDRGYDLHYLNIANGDCGSAVMSMEETAATRLEEARASAAYAGATFHPPLVGDLELFYEQWLIKKLCAIVREVNPEILLVPSPQDYMEDHENASRVMVTAAFCRCIKNFVTDPPSEAVFSDMAVYHALPYGLRDPLRNLIQPEFFVDISSVMDRKRAMLTFHRSQKEWLDAFQGVDNYLKTMEDMCAQVGAMSGKFPFAEGWRRHSYLGFGPEEFDPLKDALEGVISQGKLLT
jgi:N-acetylglucosamine malate deacetylase 1